MKAPQRVHISQVIGEGITNETMKRKFVVYDSNKWSYMGVFEEELVFEKLANREWLVIGGVLRNPKGERINATALNI